MGVDIENQVGNLYIMHSKAGEEHLIEQVGRRLRSMMPVKGDKVEPDNFINQENEVGRKISGK